MAAKVFYVLDKFDSKIFLFGIAQTFFSLSLQMKTCFFHMGKNTTCNFLRYFLPNSQYRCF